MLTIFLASIICLACECCFSTSSNLIHSSSSPINDLLTLEVKQWCLYLCDCVVLANCFPADQTVVVFLIYLLSSLPPPCHLLLCMLLFEVLKCFREKKRKRILQDTLSSFSSLSWCNELLLSIFTKRQSLHSTFWGGCMNPNVPASSIKGDLSRISKSQILFHKHNTSSLSSTLDSIAPLTNSLTS